MDGDPLPKFFRTRSSTSLSDDLSTNIAIRKSRFDDILPDQFDEPTKPVQFGIAKGSQSRLSPNSHLLPGESASHTPGDGRRTAIVSFEGKIRSKPYKCIGSLQVR